MNLFKQVELGFNKLSPTTNRTIWLLRHNERDSIAGRLNYKNKK